MWRLNKIKSCITREGSQCPVIVRTHNPDAVALFHTTCFPAAPKKLNLPEASVRA